MRLVSGEEIADNLRALCDEESFTAAILLLFQLTDEFYLIFADHLKKVVNYDAKLGIFS